VRPGLVFAKRTQSVSSSDRSHSRAIAKRGSCRRRRVYRPEWRRSEVFRDTARQANKVSRNFHVLGEARSRDKIRLQWRGRCVPPSFLLSLPLSFDVRLIRLGPPTKYPRSIWPETAR
jgi:hypothetical protein